MIYDMAIAVRISSDKDAKIVEQINRCEGETFSDRFRTFSPAVSGGHGMKKARRGPEEPRAKPKTTNSLFVANGLKITAKFYGYAPRKCEECKRPLTWRDRQEAPYADGRFLCAECRTEYMVHHSDPFFLSGGVAV